MAQISSRGRGRQAPSHGKEMGEHLWVVAHTLECEAREGLAYELTVPDGAYLQTAGVSPHTLSDPAETCWACDTDLIGYHVGPSGNPASTGGEVTGRASWTREQWLTGSANQALQRQAQALAGQAVAKGFAPGEFRWLSLAEVAGRRVRGFCYHYDISRALGGSDHWDPGPGYPADVQMSRIRWYAGVADYWGEDPATRPDGVTGGGLGGAQASHWIDRAVLRRAA